MKDFPDEWSDIIDVLGRLIIRKSWIEVGGGNESKVSKFMGSELRAKGWAERKFRTAILVDDHQTESPTHKVDSREEQDVHLLGPEFTYKNCLCELHPNAARIRIMLRRRPDVGHADFDFVVNAKLSIG